MHDVVKRHDPERLLAGGLRDDEYDPEVDEIAARIRTGQPITPEVLAQIWERWFGPGSGYVTTVTYHQIATFAAELDALR